MKYISDVATRMLYPSEEKTLFSKKILHVAGLLHNSHIDPNLIRMPRLVVVGTQSSGKSSVLNAIMGMDLLPTGTSMTTRTPITLEMTPCSDARDARIEFGVYHAGTWTTERSLPIHYPALTQEERDAVRSEIEKRTVMLAGPESNISALCIILKIVAPSLPMLSMTDLPGLVSVAITDRGQPKDIRQQIQHVVSTYASSPSSLIMAIIAARPDIEADMAMEIIKEMDPKGERSIGILTKLDLMNHDGDIRPYLENKVSRDLQFAHGYYGVCTKQSTSMVETLLAEKTYFASHPVYHLPAYQSQLGIPRLSSRVSSILIDAIASSIPHVITVLQQKEDEIAAELAVIGTSLPKQKEIRSTIVQGLIHQCTKQYVVALEGRGSGRMTGKLIHDVLGEYRSSLVA